MPFTSGKFSCFISLIISSLPYHLGFNILSLGVLFKFTLFLSSLDCIFNFQEAFCFYFVSVTFYILLFLFNEYNFVSSLLKLLYMGFVFP